MIVVVVVVAGLLAVLLDQWIIGKDTGVVDQAGLEEVKRQNHDDVALLPVLQTSKQVNKSTRV
jgi:hypothetical protein